MKFHIKADSTRALKTRRLKR